MSQELISRNDDLKKLRDEGYLRGEGLVDLEQIDVGELEPGSCEEARPVIAGAISRPSSGCNAA